MRAVPGGTTARMPPGCSAPPGCNTTACAGPACPAFKLPVPAPVPASAPAPVPVPVPATGSTGSRRKAPAGRSIQRSTGYASARGRAAMMTRGDSHAPGPDLDPAARWQGGSGSSRRPGPRNGSGSEPTPCVIPAAAPGLRRGFLPPRCCCRHRCLSASTHAAASSVPSAPTLVITSRSRPLLLPPPPPPSRPSAPSGPPARHADPDPGSFKACNVDLDPGSCMSRVLASICKLPCPTPTGMRGGPGSPSVPATATTASSSDPGSGSRCGPTHPRSASPGAPQPPPPLACAAARRMQRECSSTAQHTAAARHAAGEGAGGGGRRAGSRLWTADSGSGDCILRSKRAQAQAGWAGAGTAGPPVWPAARRSGRSNTSSATRAAERAAAEVDAAAVAHRCQRHAPRWPAPRRYCRRRTPASCSCSGLQRMLLPLLTAGTPPLAQPRHHHRAVRPSPHHSAVHPHPDHHCVQRPHRHQPASDPMTHSYCWQRGWVGKTGAPSPPPRLHSHHQAQSEESQLLQPEPQMLQPEPWMHRPPAGPLLQPGPQTLQPGPRMHRPPAGPRQRPAPAAQLRPPQPLLQPGPRLLLPAPPEAPTEQRGARGPGVSRCMKL